MDGVDWFAIWAIVATVSGAWVFINCDKDHLSMLEHAESKKAEIEIARLNLIREPEKRS